jgi:hypothetical protein
MLESFQQAKPSRISSENFQIPVRRRGAQIDSGFSDLAWAATRNEHLEILKFAMERKSITNGAGFVWSAQCLTELFLFERCVSGKKAPSSPAHSRKSTGSSTVRYRRSMEPQKGIGLGRGSQSDGDDH